MPWDNHNGWLGVKHQITTTTTTCSDLIEIRQSHFTSQSLRELFQKVSSEKIFNFLKEINIFGKNLNLR